VIWSIEMQCFLKSTVLTVVGTTQSSASMVMDVPEIGRHDAELVQMPLPHPWAGQRTIKDEEKAINTETGGAIVLNKLSLMQLTDWNLTYSSNGLAKLQHKMQ